MSSTVDLRGFVYPLEPQLNRQRWELERLQGQVAQLGSRINGLEKQLKDAEDNYGAQHAYLAASVQQRPDPAMHRRALDYLVRARNMIAGLEQELEEVRKERSRLLERCIEQQRRIQMLEEHRVTQLQEYVQEEQARLASEQDREWSARSLWAVASKQAVARGAR